MKTVGVFLLYLLQLITGDNSTSCKVPEVRDYYWRDYTGVIPQDAVPGGTDRKGLTTYIGQVVVCPWGQLPASIYQGNDTAVASASKSTIHVDRNVKILCSGSLHKFQWIPTDINKIQLLTDCHLVSGGVDLGHQENIGRVNYNEEVILGKVIRKPLEHDGLWIPNRGSEIRFTSYQVLAYDCKPDSQTRLVIED